MPLSAAPSVRGDIPNQDHDPGSSSPKLATLQVPKFNPSRRGATVPPTTSRPHSPYNNSSIALSQTSVITANEEPNEDIPESELRRIYENEEIDRFLRVFVREVHEVRIHPAHEGPTINITGTGTYQSEVSIPQSPTSYLEEEAEDEAEGWMKVSERSLDLPLDIENRSRVSLALQSERCLSAVVAQDYLLPHLPERQLAADRFTLTRFRLAVQRLYLVCYPIYYPLFLRMWRLAAWEEYWRSAFWCMAFWGLWWYNFLLPAMCLRMLVTLLLRKFLQFPSRSELRRRRMDAKHAEAMGEALQAKFDLDGGLTFRDAWRVFRLVVRGKKKKAKRTAKETISAAEEKREGDVEQPFDDGADSQKEDDDARRALMNLIQDVADLHERVTNISLWRRPVASARYTLFLIVLMLVTILPSQYLIKSFTFLVAFFYWFIIPVLLQLNRHERARLPPPFADVPTDAEYAMELIAERVARGESVLPARMQKRHRSKHGKDSKSVETASALGSPIDNCSMIGELSEGEMEESPTTEKKSRIDIDWRKLREKPVIQTLLRKDKDVGSTSDPAEVQQDIHHTYPAQHIASPGVLTLTDSELLFTVVVSSTPKIRIPLKDIRGVKKTGRLGGITLRYLRETTRTSLGVQDKGVGQDEDGTKSGAAELSLAPDPPLMEEVEEKFRWIAGRDEVFARLVGWNGRRWRKV